MILDIVVPVFNNEKQIQNIYNKLNEELSNIKHKFIFVDNFSTDKTLDVLENIYKSDEENVKIVSMATNDKDLAIYTGLYFTKHDLVCIYDLDLNANVSYISKMYDLLSKNKQLDEVCLCLNNKKSSNYRYKIYNFILNTKYNSNITYYRMMRQEVVSSLIILSQSHKFSIYSLEMIGYNKQYISVDNKNDYINNVDFKTLFNYSENPLILIKYFSYILMFISTILIILSLLTSFKINKELLLIILLFINSINLFILSIVINCKNNTKTDFFVRKKIGFDENFL